MNISIHASPQRDFPLVKVSSAQLQQLISGNKAPKLNCWEKFCNFFLTLISCAYDGSRRASEEQLREIYQYLHPNRGAIQSEAGAISAFFSAVEKLIMLTDNAQREQFFFYG